jgi:hypothetical protein
MEVSGQLLAGSRPEIFLGGGGGSDPEAIRHLCFIFKIISGMACVEMAQSV